MNKRLFIRIGVVVLALVITMYGFDAETYFVDAAAQTENASAINFDVDSDGEFNIVLDGLALRILVLNAEYAEKGDLNGDGTVNVCDMVLLYKTARQERTALMPLIVDVSTELSWTSAFLPKAMYGKNCEFIVSGYAGSNILTVESHNVVSPSEIGSTEWWGGILTENGVDSYVPYNVKYRNDNEFEIYPALEKDINGAVLANYVLDAGTTYSAMHLTKRGYQAYAQYVYSADPKYCDKNSCIALFDAYNYETSTSEYGTFESYGGKKDIYLGNRNVNMLFWDSLSSKSLKFGYPSAWGTKYEHDTQTGVKWENIDLDNKDGYMELYIGGMVDGYKLPEQYQIYVDLYLDGELSQRYVKDDVILEKICMDFSGAESATVDIYFSGLGLVNAKSLYAYVSRCSFWENVYDYDSQLVRPKATVVQNFDSWGVFSDGETASEFSRLHNIASGQVVSYVNNSSGGKTASWAKENFETNVLKYSPEYVLFDFAINDTNSASVTAESYREDMLWLFEESINNNIQPILIMPTLHGNYCRYVLNLMDA